MSRAHAHVPHSNASATPKPCGLMRRLLALTYDGLLLVGLWMIATAFVVVANNEGVSPSTTWFQLYLLSVAGAYFVVSWRRGCTLGMKAWHIRILGDQQPIPYVNLGLRFVVAWASAGAFGIGFWWALFHPQKATWHDLASKTQLVVIPKPSASRQ